MFIPARNTNVVLHWAAGLRQCWWWLGSWMLDLSADQWRINEFSLRETFDNNPILSVTRRAAHINNKQRCVSIDLSNQNFHVGEWSKWKVGPDKWGQLGRSRKLKGGVMMLVQPCRYHVFLSTSRVPQYWHQKFYTATTMAFRQILE